MVTLCRRFTLRSTMLRPLRTCVLQIHNARQAQVLLLPNLSRISRSCFNSTSFRRTLTNDPASTPDSSPSPVSDGTSGVPSLLEHLKDRGLVETVTGLAGSLDTFLRTNKITTYAGVDPTARSLHVGHLLPLMNLLHFYLNGHNSIALVGKSTAAVGDPSGRLTERDKSTLENTPDNFSSIWAQIERFFHRGEEYALSHGYNKAEFGTFVLRTNGEWLENLGLVDFLSNVGRVIRVQQMLARQSVKTRMASQSGINFAEFTYQLLQSYDFWWLYKNENCKLQIGGNDQYGNITAGIDLIQRLDRESSSSDSPPVPAPAYGLTVPLLTTPTGEKFGKSAGNAVWLDPTLTTPFELYQYLLRLPDTSLSHLLKSLTLLPLSTISDTLSRHFKHPESRLAQRVLAGEVVRLVHGPEEERKCAGMTRLLFPLPTMGEDGSGINSDGNGNLEEEIAKPLTSQDLISAFTHDRKRFITFSKTEVMEEYITKIAAKSGAVKTRSEAENLVKQGGLYIAMPASASSSLNAEEQQQQQEKEEGRNGPGFEIENTPGMRKVERGEKFHEGLLIDGEVLLLRVGKGGVMVIRVV